MITPLTYRLRNEKLKLGVAFTVGKSSISFALTICIEGRPRIIKNSDFAF